MTSKELEELPAGHYREPALFVTAWDTPELNDKQYAEGLRLGRELKRISIGCNGCWGGVSVNDGVVTSYERIGYHASTAALLQGMLDSGVEITVYRHKGEPVRIQ